MDEDGTARPPAPLTCCSCSGLSSSQQSIIDDAITQVLGPGATMDSLVQLTPSPRSEVDETPAPAAARRFLPLGMRSIDPQAAGLRALAEAGIQGGGLWAEGTAETEAAEPEAPEEPPVARWCRPVVLSPGGGSSGASGSAASVSAVPCRPVVRMPSGVEKPAKAIEVRRNFERPREAEKAAPPTAAAVEAATTKAARAAAAEKLFAEEAAAREAAKAAGRAAAREPRGGGARGDVK